MPTEQGNERDSLPAEATRSFGRRRALLAGGAVLAAGVGVAADEAARRDRADGAAGAPSVTTAFPFHGARQAGVTAPQQPATQLLAFDLPRSSVAGERTALRTVLGSLTGTLAGAASEQPRDPRLQGGGTTRLISLVGIGPATAARLRLDVPASLAALPAFPGDRLDPRRSDGDVLVQLCAADRWTLTVVAELVATAVRTAGAQPRWNQSGFLAPTPPGTTPRNLFGSVDGTANPGREAAERWVWGESGAHRDGTVLVYRRIRMDVEGFAALSEERRDRAVGRRTRDGAPLSGTAEHDEPDIYAKNPDGSYVIPATAHVRLASPRFDRGARMLRRSYSYDDGPDDRGLLFCAFMRDPGQFVRVQERLAARDALNPFVQHRASAVAYVLPGATESGTLGDRLWG
ncbi:Dyp-type peroxidase [Streptomyces sp. NPDC048718]|uniref:Dyp-type peroxidase n=1 Tax=Streptomyces sp. NPDC048718 TaxID=3365587 RepID=UPI003715E8AE